MAPTTVPEAPSPQSRLTFLDLPHETQEEIFSHCLQNDLIALSLVSKHFRSLAAAQLYRSFVFILPEENDPARPATINRLAGGLDTFAISDYNYAQHLRDIHFDTQLGAPQAELAYKSCLSGLGSARFLDTLLRLTLRKATSLESFRWNIRVELSRPTWHALHGISTLRKFSIRLQAGASTYEAPPPLPLLTSAPSSTPPPPAPAPGPAHATNQAIPQLVPMGTVVMPTQTTAVFFTSTELSAPPPKPSKTKGPKKMPVTPEPPTLSGLKNLRDLAVLDIESLDMVAEIKSCVRNSAGTLTKLSLSFSDTLGARARKPAPDPAEEDSDIDDEFQGSAASSDETNAPAQAFRAKEQRTAQEAALGRIFDVEPVIVSQPGADKTKLLKLAIKQPTAEEFAIGLKRVATLLMFAASGSRNVTPAHLEVLAALEQVAKKYVVATWAAAQAAVGQPNGEGSSSSASKPETNTEAAQPGPGVSGGGPGTGDANPEDIRVEEPEEQLSLDFMDGSSTEAPESGPTAETSQAKPSAEAAGESQQPSSALSSQANLAIANLQAQRLNFNRLSEKLRSSEKRVRELSDEIQQLGLSEDASPAILARMDAAAKEMRAISESSLAIQKDMEAVAVEIRDAEKLVPAAASSGADDAEARSSRVADYIRSTRGIALQTLRIYLIPVKASVLSRAVDVRALRSLTLLNVGSQAPIWNLLARENKAEPLPLRSIFTDNVQTPFLVFAAQLPELHELFLLERDASYKPESFAPKTKATIEQIRKTVLEAHAGTLKRLMIKNQADQSWDADEKTMLLLCRRGANLLELAISLNIHTIHVLLQRLAGLAKLRALLIIHLRNDDTCTWVMRVTRLFFLDVLAHAPQLPLRWISIDDGDKVDYIVRHPADQDDRDQEKDGKGPGAKGKGKVNAAATIKAAVMSVAPDIGDDGHSNFANGIFPTMADAEWEDGEGPDVDDDPQSADDDDDDESSLDDTGFNFGPDYADSTTSSDDGEAAGVLGAPAPPRGSKALKCNVDVRRFHDAWAVKIFRKEVVAGNL